MKRLALVTGAAGFIGRHVCHMLSSQGWRVAGIGWGDWPASEQEAWGLSVWRKEKVSLEALECLARTEGEAEILIHCAGGSSVAFSLERPREDFEQTVATTADVLEFARLRTGRMAIAYPSSAAVYGATGRCPITESMPLKPVSPYGVHKLMAEELCQSYAAHWNIPVAVVRLFSVYGLGLRKQLLWDACVKAHAGTFSFFGSGKEVRDWLHVSDAAALLVLAAEKASRCCPIVNGGTGIGISNERVLAEIGQYFTGVDRAIFSGKERRGDPNCYIADITKLYTWKFNARADMKVCIQQYVNWFKKESES